MLVASNRPELNAGDAEELLQLLRRNPEGIPMSKRKQTYFSAEGDLLKMFEEGKVSGLERKHLTFIHIAMAESLRS